MSNKLKLDLKKLSKNHLVTNLTEHLNGYEEKVRGLVKEFDLRSRDAREKSRTQLDKFTLKLKEARGNVEARVVEVLSSEGQRINKGMNDLLKYLKSVSKNEKLKVRVAQPKKRTKKATSGKKTRTQRTASRARSAKAEAAPGPQE